MKGGLEDGDEMACKREQSQPITLQRHRIASLWPSRQGRRTQNSTIHQMRANRHQNFYNKSVASACMIGCEDGHASCLVDGRIASLRFVSASGSSHVAYLTNVQYCARTQYSSYRTRSLCW